MTEQNRAHLAFALIALAAATALAFAKILSGEGWISGMTWLTGIYMVGQPAAVLASGWAVATAGKAVAAVSNNKPGDRL